MAMEILKGLRTTLKEFGQKPTTVSYPEERRALAGALSRPACAASLPEWSGALRRLLPLRRGLPGRRYLYRGRGEHRGEPGLPG